MVRWLEWFKLTENIDTQGWNNKWKEYIPVVVSDEDKRKEAWENGRDSFDVEVAMAAVDTPEIDIKRGKENQGGVEKMTVDEFNEIYEKPEMIAEIFLNPEELEELVRRLDVWFSNSEANLPLEYLISELLGRIEYDALLYIIWANRFPSDYLTNKLWRLFVYEKTFDLYFNHHQENR